MKMNEPIRLLICDDQAIVCEGLNAILSKTSRITIVGTAINGEDCILKVEKLIPDIVLMDLKMPVMNGVIATRIIKEKFPNTLILVLTTFDNDEWILDAIRSGASGYVLKDTPKETLLSAIYDTVSGRNYIDPQVAGKVLDHIVKTPGLTKPDEKVINILNDRELEILHCLARGKSNSEIANIMFLSESTIKNYMSNIFIKIGVTDRTQAAIFALKSGF
jgi:two-component system, NarL family, response regulator LiaR